MSASVSTLGDSGWLIHVQSVLAGSAWIAARVALESATVLVHCRSEGFSYHFSLARPCNSLQMLTGLWLPSIQNLQVFSITLFAC